MMDATQVIGTVAAAGRDVAARVAMQIDFTLFRIGSHFSIFALALSAAAFVILVARGRRRAVPLRVMRRVLFPRRMTRTASGRTDIAFTVFALTFSGMAIGWALFSAETIRAAVALRLGTPPAPWLPDWAATAIVTVALFVGYEFAYWCAHAVQHRVPVLWHFHKVHHQAESLSLLTNFRVHPVDTIIFLNIAAIVLGLVRALADRTLGGHPSAWEVGTHNAVLFVLSILVSNLQHSQLWETWGPRWGRVLLGPAHHQIHHSREERHYNRNFGNVLTLFDRLFGTFHQPSAERDVTRFGVEDGTPAPHSWRAATIDPFVHAGADLIAPLRRHHRDRAGNAAPVA